MISGLEHNSPERIKLMTANPDFKQYLDPTFYIDSDSDTIKTFSDRICSGIKSPEEKAVKLYYGIRDGIKYDPYSIDLKKESMKASVVLGRKYGYCVAKAVVLAACARSQGIPAKLGFADVKNHLNTKKLRALMGTDLFVYHGFTELYLFGKWVKATPAFDINLCTNFNVKPLEFDGTYDSVFHEYNRLGDRHMEYVTDHGSFSDLPAERIISESIKAYPNYFENLERLSGNFSKEAKTENN